MALPFTVEQFYGAFRDHNMAVSEMLGLLCAWSALVSHQAFFSPISPAAYGIAAVSAVGAIVFVWQGVVRRKLTFRWAPGPKAAAGTVLIAFAPVLHPVWPAYAGHPYPTTPTFGLPCPTTIFTIAMRCFALPHTPRSPLIVPILWCAVGAQAAFFLGVWPDLGLIAAGVVDLALLPPLGRPLRTRTS